MDKQHDLIRAFVAGAEWWEYHKTGCTMWPSDRNLAEQEAVKRYPESGMMDIRVKVSKEDYRKLEAICARWEQTPEEMLTEGIEIAILEDEQETAANKLLGCLTEETPT